MNNLFVRLPHVRRHRITINIHRGTDVGMAHQLLLHTYRSSNRIKPTSVSMPEHVGTDVADSSFSARHTCVYPNLVASAIGLVAALVVLWNVSRFEHVLARSNAYRILRHAVRLALIAGVAVAAIERSQGIPISYAALKLNFTHVLSDPRYLGTVVGVILASHFILWNWKWARDFWHRRLMAAQLRKRGTWGARLAASVR